MIHTANLFLILVALFFPPILSARSGPEVYSDAKQISAAADKNLNAAYEQLLKSIKADNDKEHAQLLETRLRESQRAWLKYRDAQVAFVATHANIGSASSRAAGMASYSVELTQHRIKDLTTVPNPF